MKVQWFSLQELDELKLPAIRRDRAHILRQATSEGWRSRPRAGRGGGREYYIGSLPEAARIELARRAIISSEALNDTSSPLSGFVATGGALPAGPVLPLSLLAPPQATAGGRTSTSTIAPASRSQARGAARNIIVSLLMQFRDAGGLSIIAARSNFAALYNAGAIDVEPWVRAEVGRLTVRSLERWASQLAREGAQRLSGKYGHRKGTGQIEGDPAMLDFCITVMASNGKKTAKHLREDIRARFGREIPKRTIQRFMSRAREEHAKLFLMAQNPDAWKNRYQVAFGSLSAAVAGPNDIWEADASPADIMCVDPTAESGKRRYHLIGNIDVWSRRVKILVTETPKSSATMCLIRRSILDWGKQRVQKTDNGKDFKSAYIIRSFSDLQIEHKLCPPFTPEGKPHIERFFRTLQHDLIATLPGFIGHNVADRKAIEAQRSFADRLGEADELIEVSLTADELQGRIDDWLAHDYHRRHHEGIGTSPMLKMAEWTGPITRIENERALDVLLMEAPDTKGFRTVSKKGIRIENATFIAPELGLYTGERVQVRLDPSDMGQVVVYSTEGEFLCVAKCPERSGIDRREVAVIAKQLQKSKRRELERQLAAAKREHNLGTLADDVAAMKRDDANTLVAFPRAESTEHHTTPALEAAAEAARRLAGIEPAPEPISDYERALAAEAAATLPQATILTLPERAQEVREEALSFADDVEFYACGMSTPEKLNASQRQYFETVVKNDPSVQLRWQMRYGANATG